MPCPHNEISIVQRSQQQSAVAAAAYQSGEKLFCGYDQEVKHYPEKRGIVHNEILLPPNAPQEYADRNTLWNAAEAVEKQWNSQLARRWVLTIPREIPPDQYAVLVREFCEQQFVSKGMIADFTIHAARFHNTSGRSSPPYPPCGFSICRTEVLSVPRFRQGHKPCGSWEAIFHVRPLPS